MAKYMQNLIFHILNIFLSLCLLLVFTFLFPIGRYLRFSLGIQIAENMLTSYFSILIIKVTKRSTMHVHDVTANLPFTIHIIK
jgi:hypothetical protein